MKETVLARRPRERLFLIDCEIVILCRKYNNYITRQTATADDIIYYYTAASVKVNRPRDIVQFYQIYSFFIIIIYMIQTRDV